MKNCLPQPVWQGQDCYIIGGGPSLKNFDWNLLRGFNTIGCNDAYVLGEDICKVVLFGDHKWWHAHEEKLKQYQGQIFSIASRLENKLPERIQPIKRFAKGIQTQGIGWNGNTGFAAINLGILLGCTNIYLLGFDMKRFGLESNWHKNRLDKNPDSVYQKFLDWSKYVKEDWELKFPDVGIVNVTDDSKLTIFPKVTTKEFWLKRMTA